MKQAISLLLALCLLAAFGCAPAPGAEKPDATEPAAQVVTVRPEAVEPTPAEAPVDDANAAAKPLALTQAQEAAISAMQPVLDSVLRTVGVGEGCVWPGPGADRTEELWTALYLLGVNWRSSDPRTKIDGPRLLVPRQLMNEWAGALTAEFAHLPELTPDVTFIEYDAAAKTYSMELSDVGATETRIDAMDANADGTFTVKLGLYDDFSERLGGMDFILIDNPFLFGPVENPQLDDPEILPVENPEFLYTVLSGAAD